MNSSLKDCKTFLDLCQRCDSLDELSLKMSVMNMPVPDMRVLMLYDEMHDIEKFTIVLKFWENKMTLNHLQARVMMTIVERCKEINHPVLKFSFRKFSSLEYMLDVLRLIRDSGHENKKFIKTAIIDFMYGPKTNAFKRSAEFLELLERLKELV